MIARSLAPILLMASSQTIAQPIFRDEAMRAAVHPVATAIAMRRWLVRVPVTRDFPDDLAPTLRESRSAWIIEITTTPDCLPCGDLWTKLGAMTRSYGLPARTLSKEEAMLRSGRLGLPWIGHPVAWLRPIADQDRAIPIAIGTDHQANLTRNAYLAIKMLTGVRPAVAVRAMSKFTGIVAMPSTSTGKR